MVGPPFAAVQRGHRRHDEHRSLDVFSAIMSADAAKVVSVSWVACEQFATQAGRGGIKFTVTVTDFAANAGQATFQLTVVKPPPRSRSARSGSARPVQGGGRHWHSGLNATDAHRLTTRTTIRVRIRS